MLMGNRMQPFTQHQPFRQKPVLQTGYRAKEMRQWEDCDYGLVHRHVDKGNRGTAGVLIIHSSTVTIAIMIPTRQGTGPV